MIDRDAALANLRDLAVHHHRMAQEVSPGHMYTPSPQGRWVLRRVVGDVADADLARWPMLVIGVNHDRGGCAVSTIDRDGDAISFEGPLWALGDLVPADA